MKRLTTLLILNIVIALLIARSTNNAPARAEYIWLTEFYSGQPILVKVSRGVVAEEFSNGPMIVYQNNKDLENFGVTYNQVEPISVKEDIQEILRKMREPIQTP